MPFPLDALPDGLCVLLCAAAAVTDLRRYEIPNWLTFAGAAAGLAINGVLGGLVPALEGGGALLLVAGVLGALRVWGMGDVKLLAAAGLLVRWPLALLALLDTALVGGAVAIVLLLAGRKRTQRMPYALAIALGVGWAVLSRRLPALRLI